MRGLNRRYRRRDRTTDVLAFPMREATGPPTHLLGDVVISLPTAARQAAALGRSVDQEVAMLLVHGVLHLLGYEHERGEREARHMRRKELAVLRSLGRIPKLFVD
jgi:rRNA maturation RNase YbeY